MFIFLRKLGALVVFVAIVFGVLVWEYWVSFGAHIHKFLWTLVVLKVPSKVTQVTIDQLSAEAFLVRGWSNLFVGTSPE